MNPVSSTPDRERIFRSLYEAVYPDLLRFAQRRTGPAHAEDVVADAFLVVWRRLDEMPPTHGQARAWIFGVGRNILLNTHRGERRRRALGVRLANATTLPPSDIVTEGVVSRVDLGEAWRRLTEVQQEALSLAVLEGLNAPEAATVLGISPVAFRLRLSRARRALRHHLEQVPPSTTGRLRDASERTAAP